jgi:hypothetical protein
MALTANKVFRVIEKQFRNNGPALNIAEPGAQAQLSEKIYRIVESFEKKCVPALLSLYSKENYRYYRNLGDYNEKNSVIFSIHTSWRMQKPYIIITFDDNGNLIVEGYDNNDNSKKGPFLCRGTEDIERLLNLVKSENEKADKADKKRKKTAQRNWKKHEKIKDLKNTAILTKIKELAAEEKLTYALEEYSTKVKFLIKLSETEMFEISIPYKNFQSVLRNIKTAVTALFDLREKGINIKHKRYTREKAPIWSHHD